MTSTNGIDRKLSFIVIGAGMAGILAAIRLKKAGYEDVVIYEKADRVGGTWRENTYPGLTCDVPSHSYTYSFAPNPDWTRHMPPGPEVYDYFEGVAKRYNVLELIRFNEEVTSCVFERGAWQLRTKSGLADTADFVIAATGVLHHTSYPDIAGLGDFKGAMFHTARWDHSVSLAGRVGVIGTVSTGVQIITALAGHCKTLKQFQRTAQWVMPLPNTAFSEEERAAFRNSPELLRELHDDAAYLAGTKMFSDAITDANSDGLKMLEAMCLNNLEENVKDPVLREKLRPNYRVACKRLIISPDYYQKLQTPGVELVTEAIERVEAGGIRTKDGKLHELDVIALATGFKADQFMRPMNIVGRNGVALNDVWAKRPSAYLAISIPEFPNLFMVNGPTGPVGNFSLIDIAERELHYIDQLIELVRSGQCREVSVTHEAMDDYEARRIVAAKKTIFASGCKSWYLDSEGIPSTWPWTYTNFMEEMQAPKLQAYQLVA
jgi:cation diffusion facilitator CzcD-associated flavoprotein CzcO